MTATRHKISAQRSGSHPTMGDWDADYEITFTIEPGSEPVFVSINPGADDPDSHRNLIEWATDWLDENADKAMQKADADNLLQEAEIR